MIKVILLDDKKSRYRVEMIYRYNLRGEYKMIENITTINTDNIVPPSEGEDLYSSRKNVYKCILDVNQVEVSICVQAYNRLEKTKYCVESLLKNTTDINYELILVDNGSTDDTYEFFKSIQYENKKIIRITHNIGMAFSFKEVLKLYTGNILVLLSNDVYVTKNWLSNILKCMYSDERIGMVVPTSTNVSNKQCCNLSFTNLEEMQLEAEKYNQSDSKKWEERLRLITLAPAIKREVFDLVGSFDVGFFHDFLEDDLCLRIRRAGYKMMLAGDTFVHHDHNVFLGEDKDHAIFQQSLETGRSNFRLKHHGIDGWNDVLNFESMLLDMSFTEAVRVENPNILGIDVRCGTPILEIKNYLRKQGVFQSKTNAFTTHAKYYADLQCISSGEVVCDRIDYIEDYFVSESFDYILIGEAINSYKEPIRLLQKVINLSKSKGKILFKLTNTADVGNFLEALGQKGNGNKNMPIYLPMEELNECLKVMNIEHIEINAEMHRITKEMLEELRSIIVATGLVSEVDQVVNQLGINEYLYYIVKK